MGVFKRGTKDLLGGGGGTKGTWAAGTAYAAGESVVLNGIAYTAVAPSTGVTPSPINAPVKDIAGVTNASGGGAHSDASTWRFTPTENLVLDGVALRFWAGGSNTSIAIRRVSDNAIIVNTTVSSYGSGQVAANVEVDYPFASQVTLSSGVEYSITLAGGYLQSLASGATLSRVTSGTYVSNSTGNALAGIPLVRLYRNQTNPWLAQGGAFGLSTDGTTIIPGDVNDNWVVGALSMEPAGTPERIRAMFNKAKGAFRAGSSNGNAWDGANVGNYSAAFGIGNTASGESSFVEGNSNTASGLQSHAEGQGTSAQGTNSHAEGNGTIASGTNSHAQGFRAVANRVGQHAMSSGRHSATGDAQASQMVLLRSTTDATPQSMTAGDANTAVNLNNGAITVLTCSQWKSYKYKITVVAQRSDAANEAAAWEFNLLVSRSGSGAAARIIGTPIAAAWGDTPATDTWDVTLSINSSDSTTNYLDIRVTGEAGKTIRWVADAQWVEVA